MQRYSIKKGQTWSGEVVGILTLDETIPRVPGSVCNAETFSFPVRFKKIHGATVERLLDQRDSTLAELFVEAARELEMDGVKAIAGGCGFMALFQKEVSEAVSVPVCLSSLMQIPFILSTMPTSNSVGVITADAGCLTSDFLLKVGVLDFSRIIIKGLEETSESSEVLREKKLSVDADIMKEEVVELAAQLISENKNLGAILLECSELPPYSYSVQEKFKIPVYDFSTLIHYIASVADQKQYLKFR